jgi:hypothetical protein
MHQLAKVNQPICQNWNLLQESVSNLVLVSSIDFKNY